MDANMIFTEFCESQEENEFDEVIHTIFKKISVYLYRNYLFNRINKDNYNSYFYIETGILNN